MSRQAFVQKEIWKHKSVRIFSCSYAGKKIWVKQAEPVRNVSWLRFARRDAFSLDLVFYSPVRIQMGGERCALRQDVCGGSLRAGFVCLRFLPLVTNGLHWRIAGTI